MSTFNFQVGDALIMTHQETRDRETFPINLILLIIEQSMSDRWETFSHGGLGYVSRDSMQKAIRSNWWEISLIRDGEILPDSWKTLL